MNLAMEGNWCPVCCIGPSGKTVSEAVTIAIAWERAHPGGLCLFHKEDVERTVEIMRQRRRGDG